jgi:hemerythrin HHE cation binding domain-containing protein
MSEVSQRPDVWGMAWVHQVYRREIGLLPALIRGVADGDTERAEIVGEHLDVINASLLDHHLNEDELIWPKLLERARPHADDVARMEAQHTRLHTVLDEIGPLLATWRGSAAAADRDRLADLVEQEAAASEEHFADEEQNVVPLIIEHVSQSEWDEFELAGRKSVAGDKELLFFGLGLEDATPHELEKFVGGVPPEVMDMWETAGKSAYAGMKARLHGTA